LLREEAREDTGWTCQKRPTYFQKKTYYTDKRAYLLKSPLQLFIVEVDILGH
jgi:hypothetical protein